MGGIIGTVFLFLGDQPSTKNHKASTIDQMVHALCYIYIINQLNTCNKNMYLCFYKGPIQAGIHQYSKKWQKF